MGRKLTHEEYVDRLKNINPNIEVIDTYVDTRVAILHRCKLDGCEWKMKPSQALYYDRGCPVCGKDIIGPPPEYKNSIWASKYKGYFSQFIDEDMMKKFTPHSKQYVNIICPVCNNVHDVQVRDLLKNPDHAYVCECNHIKYIDLKNTNGLDESSDNNKDKKIYTVYMHTAPTGKKYIGITTQDPLDRWSNGSGYINNSKFYEDICKFGWENFEHIILYRGLSRRDALSKENELIEQYNTYNDDFGYNKQLNSIDNNQTCTLTLRTSKEIKALLSNIAESESKTLNKLITGWIYENIKMYID